MTMTEPYHDPDFDEVVYGTPDPMPYGPPPATAPQAAPPQKTGMNTRGKAVLATAGLVLIGGSVIGYTIHADTAAANANKAAELSLQQQKFDLERLKVTNEIDTKQAKEQQAAEKELQAKIGACVDAHKDDSAYLQSTVEACQNQYKADHSSGADMQEAGSATGSSGGFNTSLLIGVAVIGAGGIALAKLGRRPTEQSTSGPHPHYH